MVSLPESMKPVTGDEATGVGSRRSLRDDWGWRVQKDKHRNLGDPSFWRESDRPIVAGKRLITVERRGLAVAYFCKIRREPIG